MDLSVIIPIYNHEKYIKKCLETILEDFPSNSEIIIIDDVCTDKSIKIIESLHSPYIKILHNEKNMGCAYNLNRGIEAAQGKYIGINYSDDFVEKGFYKKMLDTAIEQDADVVCANIADYDEKNETISYNDITVGNLYYGVNKEKIQLKEEPFQVPAGFLLGHWTASSASTKIIKKQYYEKYKFSGSKANDIPAIYPIMAAANKIIYYPKLYLFYRKVENSLSRANDQASYNSVAESIIKTFELLDEINAKEEKDILFANNSMSYLFNSIAEIENEKMKEECIEYFIQCFKQYDEHIFEKMEKNVYLEKALLFYETTVETYKCLVENKLEKFICLTKMKKLEKINENNNIQFKLKQNELQKQITEEQEKNRKLQIKNEELLRVIENNMEKEKNLQNQILDEQKLNKDLQTSNERLLEIIENNKLEEKKLQDELSSAEIKFEKLQQINTKINVEIENLKSTIDAYENSKSWKITKPIRIITQKINKTRRKK